MPPTPPNNSEIDKALKEFEIKSQAEQMQKTGEVPRASETPQQKEVEGVKFEIPSYGALKYYKETEAPKMVKLVMKYSGGAIKEQRQAEWILFGFVIIAIGISLFLFFGGNKGSNMSLPPGAKIIYPPGEPPRLENPIMPIK